MTYTLLAASCPCSCRAPAAFIVCEGVPTPVAIFTHDGVALAASVCDDMNRARAPKPRPALRLVKGGRT